MIGLVTVVGVAGLSVGAYYGYQRLKQTAQVSGQEVYKTPPVSEPASTNQPPVDLLPVNQAIFHHNSERGFIVDNYKLVQEAVVTKFHVRRRNNQNQYDPYAYARAVVSDHALIGVGVRENSDAQLVKLAHWNVLNFDLIKPDDFDNQPITTPNSTVSYSYAHAYNIMQTINHLKPDIIGLTEINHDVNAINATRFVQELNRFDPTNNHYSIILSGPTQPHSKIALTGQSEQVAILYNNLKFTPTDSGHFYSNPLVADAFVFQTYNQSDYVRPPFGVQFQSTTNPSSKYSVIYAHFDSPGTRKGKKDHTKQDSFARSLTEKSKSRGNGAQEWFEAQQLYKVLDEFASTHQYQNLFFMGDTNIRLGNQAQAFSTVANNAKFAFEDSLAFGTSYSQKLDPNKPTYFANPYDKVIYRSNYLLTKAF